MYMIIRHYRSSRKTKIINTCLTLEQARAHCSSPHTRKENVWFDGYTEQLYAVRVLRTRRMVRSHLTYARAESTAIEMSYRNNRRYTITPMDKL
jgi:hypothetical protein